MTGRESSTERIINSKVPELKDAADLEPAEVDAANSTELEAAMRHQQTPAKTSNTSKDQQWMQAKLPQCRELACDLREESKHRSKDGASIENCWKGKQWRRRLVTISAVTWRRTSCSKASRAVQATHCTFTCNACRSQISCGK